ncbi:hypothetical protein CDAR_533791 [Caerostris darwini]|uniref:Uncharacterized protein n=1 Tax=Caerostris darwini TaxID=1538125 RepID=A0AAV4S5L2_9ARAC|nr:hypothetical protein CDAR_533791 [Caerostris darwini]
MHTVNSHQLATQRDLCFFADYEVKREKGRKNVLTSSGHLRMGFMPKIPHKTPRFKQRSQSKPNITARKVVVKHPAHNMHLTDSKPYSHHHPTKDQMNPPA